MVVYLLLLFLYLEYLKLLILIFKNTKGRFHKWGFSLSHY